MDGNLLRLGRPIVDHAPAALFAGACFTAAPFHVARFYDGQLEHVALQWLPLYALALYNAGRRLSWRRLALCALALLLVSYTSWYYTIFCAAYTLVDLGWLALAEREDPVRFLWSFVGGAPKVNRPKRLRDIPAESKESEAMSKALRKLGFGFVGSTTLYAFMQATGMVDDHVAGCHCVR